MFIQSTEEYSRLKSSTDEEQKILTTVDANSFPLLFRGGISFGYDVIFEQVVSIYSKDKCKSTDVIGMPYVRAYKLESSGKGPRLFCDNSVISVLSDDIKKCIRKVSSNPEIYEIIWTVFACEAMGCTNDSWQNVQDSIRKKLLPASINLYLKNIRIQRMFFCIIVNYYILFAVGLSDMQI